MAYYIKRQRNQKPLTYVKNRKKLITKASFIKLLYNALCPTYLREQKYNLCKKCDEKIQKTRFIPLYLAYYKERTNKLTQLVNKEGLCRTVT